MIKVVGLGAAVVLVALLGSTFSLRVDDRLRHENVPPDAPFSSGPGGDPEGGPGTFSLDGLTPPPSPHSPAAHVYADTAPGDEFKEFLPKQRSAESMGDRGDGDGSPDPDPEPNSEPQQTKTTAAKTTAAKTTAAVRQAPQAPMATKQSSSTSTTTSTSARPKGEKRGGALGKKSGGKRKKRAEEQAWAGTGEVEEVESAKGLQEVLASSSPTAPVVLFLFTASDTAALNFALGPLAVAASRVDQARFFRCSDPEALLSAGVSAEAGDPGPVLKMVRGGLEDEFFRNWTEHDVVGWAGSLLMDVEPVAVLEHLGAMGFFLKHYADGLVVGLFEPGKDDEAAEVFRAAATGFVADTAFVSLSAGLGELDAAGKTPAAVVIKPRGELAVAREAQFGSVKALSRWLSDNTRVHTRDITPEWFGSPERLAEEVSVVLAGPVLPEAALAAFRAVAQEHAGLPGSQQHPFFVADDRHGAEVLEAVLGAPRPTRGQWEFDHPQVFVWHQRRRFFLGGGGGQNQQGPEITADAIRSLIEAYRAGTARASARSVPVPGSLSRNEFLAPGAMAGRVVLVVESPLSCFFCEMAVDVFRSVGDSYGSSADGGPAFSVFNITFNDPPEPLLASLVHVGLPAIMAFPGDGSTPVPFEGNLEADPLHEFISKTLPAAGEKKKRAGGAGDLAEEEKDQVQEVTRLIKKALAGG